MLKARLSLLASCLCCQLAVAADSQGYYRAPALHGEQLVFTAEGDLWLQDLAGKQAAERLTTHPAEEINAQWSPDGQYLAYQANYVGISEVYLLAKAGGQPKRLTFENSKVRLQGWTAQGEVLYSTDSKAGPVNQWLLKIVDPLTLQNRTLPLTDAVEGVIDSKGEYVYFIRFGLQVTGDNARQYRGGAMGQLWRYRLDGRQEAERLAAAHQGSVRQLQLWRDKILLISDRDGQANIWQLELDGSGGQALTQHQDFSVRSLRVHGDQAVYQLGADIHRLDLTSKNSQLLPVRLRSDFPYLRTRYLEKPLTYLTAVSLAGAADKAVLTMRGQLAVVGKPPLRAVNVATAAGSRSRSAVLSPDGRVVYAINDQSGENELWQFAADGSQSAKQLTKDGSTFRWGIYPSPDGRYLAHDDKQGQLWLLDLQSGRNEKIQTQGSGLTPYTDVVWSADSQQLAFTYHPVDAERSRIGLYRLADKQSKLLTSDSYLSFSPAFSPDGHWLYFISERQFTAEPASPWGDRNMGPAFDRRALIYAVPLQSKLSSPFAAATELSTEQAAGEPLPLSQLPGSLYPLPIPAGNYAKLVLNDKFIYLLEGSATGEPGQLQSVAIGNHKAELHLFSRDVSDLMLNNNGSQLLLHKGSGDKTELLLLDATATAPADTADHMLATQAVSVQLEPKTEWRQMFNDAWIMHRDSLFDARMRGLDWQAQRQHYQPLLARLTDRYELDDLLAQLMGELDALHSQVRGGDYAKATETGQQATLGAALSQDQQGVVIAQIYQTDAELPQLAGPLAKAGTDVQNQDRILAVNGRSIRSIAELNQALLQQQNQQVLLQLQRDGRSHQTVVEAISPAQEAQLRYQHWVEQTKARVASQSQQQIGYLHLNAMTAADLTVFVRDFYAQLEKPALIIDVRRNRGGNIDSIIIEKLLRRAWAFWQPIRGQAYPNMQQSFQGKLVVLADQLTYSDGETFTAGVKALGLATVIGQPTAGAGVWLSGANLLSDHGVARVAETAQFAMDGRWIIEGRGVSPDLAVENYPRASFDGADAQLSAAISYLTEQLKQNPPVRMQAQPIGKGIATDVVPSSQQQQE